MVKLEPGGKPGVLAARDVRLRLGHAVWRAHFAGAILAFAFTQGSFQQAGAEADQATARVEEQTQTAVDNTLEVINETSETAAN